MPDDPVIVPPVDSGSESKIFGISIRGVITLILTVTVCALCPFKDALLEVLKDGFFLAMGFYFGQKPK